MDRKQAARRLSPLSVALVALAGAAAGLTPISSAQAQFVWNNAAGGSWTTPGNWLPNGTPGGGDNVLISMAGAYTVTIPNGTGQAASNLSMTDAAATVLLPDNCSLTLNGASHTNSGLIQISGPGAAGNGTRLTLGNNATFGGSGRITLLARGNGDNDSAYLFYTNPANILTNASGHTINGDGHIYTALNNQGVVDADQSGLILRLFDQPKTNSGTMRATAGGTLLLNAAITQTGSGLIQAQNASAVVFQNNSVSGGTLASSGSGLIVNTNAQTSGIDSVTLASGSLLQINDNSTVNVGAGGLTNNGLVTIQNIGGAGNGTRLAAAGATTPIGGTGTITLQAIGNGDNDSAYLSYTNGANLFALGAGQLVNGAGRVYTGLVNSGVIDANVSGKVLVLTDQSKSNQGTMRATGGQLYIRTTVTQTGAGQIRADGGAVVLQGGTVVGGTMASLNGGLLLNVNGQTSAIDGVTLAQGTLQLNDNSTLLARNGLVNNGLITIQNIGGAGNGTRIIADSPSQTYSGTGTIRLQATSNFSDSAYLYYNLFGSPAVPAVVANAAGHTIAGNGRIHVGLTNNGTILADVATANREVLQLLDQAKTNNNLIRATGGGQIYLTSTTLNQSPTARIQADTGSAAVLQNSTVAGGLLTSSGTGLIVNLNGHTSRVDGVTVTAGSLLQLNDNSTLLLDNTLTNNGLVAIQTIGGAGNTTRLSAESAAATLAGGGVVRLQATSNFSDSAYLYYTAPANTLTNAPTHTIAGNGRVYVNLVNNGSVLADSNASGREVLEMLGQPKTNNATMRATGGGQLRFTSVSATQSAPGQLVADNGSVVSLFNSSITGGALASTGTGLIVNLNGQTSTLDSVTIAGGGLLQINDNSTLDVGTGGLVNSGLITIQNIPGPGNATRFRALGGGTVSGAGEVRLQGVGPGNDSAYIQGGSTAATALILGAGQTLSGTGRIYNQVQARGTIAPNQPYGTPGPIGALEALSGALTMAPTTVFNCQLASASSFDRINGNDAITVDGTLNVSFVNGFSPAAHDTFDIITGASIAGRFTTVNIPSVGAFGPAHVEYTPTAVRLVICYANCDGSVTSPTLNVNDFQCFLNKFATGDPYANCDGSTVPPVLNVNDFQCFLNKFAAGCP